MAKLPNVENAFIEEGKITEYLLSASHPRGRDKAVFFGRFGFVISDWTVLRDALLEHARTHEAVALPTNQFGTKYNVAGPLTCPNGRMPNIRAAWIVDKGRDFPRLVSVVPA